MSSWVTFFEDIGLEDLRRAGGKGANLGHLARSGYRVPPGFCVVSECYEAFLSAGGLRSQIADAMARLDFGDPESVESELAGLGEVIASSPIPPDIEEEIRLAYRRLISRREPGSLVAVRSSVGTRDLSRSSFPGQMDTYHNIKGEDEVIRRVKSCWASAFSYPAVVGRNSMGIDHMDVFVAPLIQTMVQADYAGVIFTANPLNSRPDQMVINACFGLGEGVVSGEVSADHLVVDRSSGCVVEEKIGDKRLKYVLDTRSGSGTRTVEVEADKARRPCLSSERVLELVETAAGIEGVYGEPQDIEWAYREDTLFILQSRRITTLFPADRREPAVDEGGWVSEFDTAVDPRYPFYTLSNISEVLPGVLTPLTISGIDALDYGFVKTNTDFGLMEGIEPETEHTFLGIFYNRAHLNLSVVKSITRKLPGASAQEFERMVPTGEEGWEGEEFRPTLRNLLGLPVSLLKIGRRMAKTPRDALVLRTLVQARIQKYAKIDMERVPYCEYLKWIAVSRDYRFKVITLHITSSQFAVVLFDMLCRITERWLGDSGGSLAARLVTGLQNIESAQPSMEIWDLSRKVESSRGLREIFESTGSREILDGLRSGGGEERDFLDSLEDFLGRFGYRSVFEAELMLPNWDEDPSYVFDMIKNYLQSDASFDPRLLAREREREREKALAEARSRLKGPKRFAFDFVLEQAQRYIALREYMKASLIMGIAQIKKEYHSLSRRLAREGSIPKPEDLFFLTREEVNALLRGDEDVPVGKLVSRRRVEYERNKTVVLPEYSRGRPVPLSMDEAAGQGDVEVLSGIAVSPGRASGPARVISDPRKSAEIEPGEILVAPVTDAAWTPLFVTAGALVVDVGGPLSHGSIVAREYGIPGVLNVGVATKLIETGQRITVDGYEGKVYLHPTEATGG